MAYQREVAHRAFAQEFNASRLNIPGAGEKDPSFLVTPLGAKVNRIHVVGVCTDVEPVGESGEVWRARVSDPTGVFTVYAGNYQPEAAQALSQIQPPQYVAVTGKARTYEPEPGSVFVSIRPESITVVDQATRDQWILDTARRTQERLVAMQAARAHPQGKPEDLASVPRALAEGALMAQEHYGLQDPARHWHTVETALSQLEGGQVPVHRIEAKSNPLAEAPTAAEATPAWKPPVPAAKPAGPSPEEEAFDAQVLAAVQRLEGAKGARWDDILAAIPATKPEAVEEALNRLMDKGLVYEPTLGILKTT